MIILFNHGRLYEIWRCSKVLEELFHCVWVIVGSRDLGVRLNY
jgi:hypothetical protein